MLELRKNWFVCAFLGLFFFCSSTTASLFEDLATVERVDKELNTTIPVTYNYNMSGGYFNMPSARSPFTGSMGLGFSAVPPYRNYNFAVQLYERLEVTANYHIMLGIPDYVLGPDFGDWSDRSMNYKLSFLKPEDSNFVFPGLALGMDDFFGSKNFYNQYAVATQVIPDLHAELSVGVGRGRIRGFFGGLSLFPFYRFKSPFLKGLVLSAEYDAIDYKNDRTSILGREYKTRINAGIHYTLGDVLHLSLSSLRGKKLAGSFSVNYNLGETQSLFPKFLDPPHYTGPKDYEPIGPLRPYHTLVNELAHAFSKQDLSVYNISISNKGLRQKKHLYISLANPNYPNRDDLSKRIVHVLGNLIPTNIDGVTLTVEEESLPIYQVNLRSADLVRWKEGGVGSAEMAILTTPQDIKRTEQAKLIYRKRPSRIRFIARPRTRLFFGNSAGKLKYDVSVAGGLQGYIYNQLFYDICASYKLFDGLERVRDVDKMNPSQIINVRSDVASYYRGKVGALDRAYAQKSWSLSQGWFARVAGGYFEIAYGGAAAEVLYKKAQANWAIGVEGALVAKRKYSGLTFTRKIRKLNGFTPTYKTNFIGSQYFLSLYLNEPVTGLRARLLIGQFLGRDVGARIDARRVFKNGTSIGYWVGFTSAHDVVNSSRFFDQGITFSVPLDLFSPKSTRQHLGTAASFWLRDTSAVSATGTTLNQIIHEN